MGACASCCEWTGKAIATCCKYTYKGIIETKNLVKRCCTCWWYPLKERCLGCCDSCDRRLNPYKDHAYETV